MSKHYTLGIYDYDRKKICDLYDSNLEMIGQAYNIQITEEMNGYHTLTFDIPYIIDPEKNGLNASNSSLYGNAIFGQSIYGGGAGIIASITD